MKIKFINYWQHVEQGVGTSHVIAEVANARLNTVFTFLGKDDDVEPTAKPTGFTSILDTANGQNQVWAEILAREVPTGGDSARSLSWTTDSEEVAIYVLEVEGVNHASISTITVADGTDAAPSVGAITIKEKSGGIFYGFVVDGDSNPYSYTNAHGTVISHQQTTTGNGSVGQAVFYAHCGKGPYDFGYSYAEHATKKIFGTNDMGSICFSADGTKVFGQRRLSAELHWWTLATAHDLTSAGAKNTSTNLSIAGTSNMGAKLVDSGTKSLHINTTYKVYSHTLATANDLTSTLSNSKVYDSVLSDSLTNVDGAVLTPDGLTMYLFGGAVSGNNIHKYTLTTAWDVSTASLTIGMPGPNSQWVRSIEFDGCGCFAFVCTTTDQYRITCTDDFQITPMYDFIRIGDANNFYDIIFADGRTFGSTTGTARVIEFDEAGVTSITPAPTIDSADEWVMWAFHIEAEAGDVPVVVNDSPADLGTAGLNPVLAFTGTDPESNDITYEIEINDASHDQTGGNTSNSTYDFALAYEDADVNNNESAFQLFSGFDGMLQTFKTTLQRNGTAIEGFMHIELWSVTGDVTTGTLNAFICDITKITVENLSTTLTEYEFTLPQRQQISSGTVYGVKFHLQEPGFSTASTDQIRLGTSATNSGKTSRSTWGGATFTVSTELHVGWHYQPIPLVEVESDTAAGFARSGDSEPFTSGEQVEYTVQSGDTLTADTDYWWRVKGKDKSGTDRYGEYSAETKFTASGATELIASITAASSTTTATAVLFELRELTASATANSSTTTATLSLTRALTASVTADSLTPEGQTANIASIVDGAYSNFIIISTNGRGGQMFTGDGGVLDNFVAEYDKFSDQNNGSVYGYIYAYDSGTYGTDAIPGTLLATSEGVLLSTLSPSAAQDVTFNFTGADRITLEDGTYYALVIEAIGEDTSTVLNGSGTGSAHDGNTVSYNGSTWSAGSSFDIIHQVNTLIGENEPTLAKKQTASITANSLTSTATVSAGAIALIASITAASSTSLIHIAGVHALIASVTANSSTTTASLSRTITLTASVTTDSSTTTASLNRTINLTASITANSQTTTATLDKTIALTASVTTNSSTTTASSTMLRALTASVTATSVTTTVNSSSTLLLFSAVSIASVTTSTVSLAKTIALTASVVSASSTTAGLLTALRPLTASVTANSSTTTPTLSTATAYNLVASITANSSTTAGLLTALRTLTASVTADTVTTTATLDKVLLLTASATVNSLTTTATLDFVRALFGAITANSSTSTATLNRITEFISSITANSSTTTADHTFIFTLLTPIDGAPAVGNPPVTFVWGTLPGASNFNLIVATDVGMTNEVINLWTTQSTYEASELDPLTEYFWQVRAAV